MGSRVDLYKAISAYDSLSQPLTPENKRYIDRNIREFKRKGLHLEESVRARVLDINKVCMYVCVYR